MLRQMEFEILTNTNTNTSIHSDSNMNKDFIVPMANTTVHTAATNVQVNIFASIIPVTLTFV